MNLVGVLLVHANWNVKTQAPATPTNYHENSWIIFASSSTDLELEYVRNNLIMKWWPSSMIQSVYSIWIVSSYLQFWPGIIERVIVSES